MLPQRIACDLLLAHYRDAGNTHTGVLYQDGFRMADSAEKLAEEGLYALSPSETYFPLVITQTTARRYR